MNGDAQTVSDSVGKLKDPVNFDPRCLPPDVQQIFARAWDNLQQCSTFREQCALLHVGFSVRITDIAKACNKNKGSVDRQISKYNSSSKRTGRPSAITEEALFALEDYVTSSFAKGVPVTFNDMQDFLHIFRDRTVHYSLAPFFPRR